MDSVGVLDAKTHLNALLRRVAKGETIQITRRGIPIAKLVPADDVKTPNLHQIGNEIRQLRRGIKLGKKISIRELIEEGRRD